MAYRMKGWGGWSPLKQCKDCLGDTHIKLDSQKNVEMTQLEVSIKDKGHETNWNRYLSAWDQVFGKGSGAKQFGQYGKSKVIKGTSGSIIQHGASERIKSGYSVDSVFTNKMNIMSNKNIQIPTGVEGSIRLGKKSFFTKANQNQVMDAYKKLGEKK